MLKLFAADIRSGNISVSNFPGSKLLAFFSTGNPGLKTYLGLDDSVVWAELGRMADELTGEVSDLAGRLIRRRLYKCFDFTERFGGQDIGNKRLRFKKALQGRKDIQPLEDDYALLPYKIYDFDSSSALSKVLVKEHDGDSQPTGIERLSPIIEALTKREQFYRLYVPTTDQIALLEETWKEVTK